MIENRQVQEIIAQYERHGWNLRRVLLSAPAKDELPRSLFENAEVISSDLNALWFSRISAGGRETWELRRLSGTPLALVEVFEADDDNETREDARKEMETRLAELASKFGDKRTGG